MLCPSVINHVVLKKQLFQLFGVRRVKVNGGQCCLVTNILQNKEKKFEEDLK